MESTLEKLPISLLDLLNNAVVLGRLAPYIPIKTLLNLSSTNKTIHSILKEAPETFRYVDLSGCKIALVPDMSVDHGGVNWRSQRMDEALTEDDVYCGPLRGIFSKLDRRQALASIQTLVLDGLTVPADIVSEILANTNVRMLSIRECRNLNHSKLAQALKYAVRPSRPQGTPKLRALYVFGPKDGQRAMGKARRGAKAASESRGVTVSQGAMIGAEWNVRSHDALDKSLGGCDDRWYRPSGKMFVQSPATLRSWGEALKACEGIIAFDAVLCRGPRHDASYIQKVHGNDPPENAFLPPTVANVSLGQYGCASCKSTIESPAVFGKSPSINLPLLDPPPLHSIAVEDAQRPAIAPGTQFPQLFARCQECLTGRWCERCFKWWDEACYSLGERTSEVRQAALAYQAQSDIRVFLGLCTEHCLVSEEMNGSGSGGMWG